VTSPASIEPLASLVVAASGARGASLGSWAVTETQRSSAPQT
jgi:hypothetical protein